MLYLNTPLQLFPQVDYSFIPYTLPLHYDPTNQTGVFSRYAQCESVSASACKLPSSGACDLSLAKHWALS